MNQTRTPRTRAARARRPSPTERFLEQNENITEQVVDHQTGSDGEGQRFTHTGAKMIVLYFPARWGWESREVPSTNIRMCIATGARYDCGDCGGDCSPDPMNPQYNNCPGREKFATRQCQLCGRLFYDFGARSVNADLVLTSAVNEARTADAEGTLIQDDAYTLATPASRTKATTDQHILAYHPAAAATLGLNTPDPRLVSPARSLEEARAK